MILSVKANQLAHDAIGTRGRRLTTGLLILSAILGYLAGVSALAHFIGKTAAAVLGIVAGLVSTCALLALTMQKPGDHLRVAGEYEALYLAAVQIDVSKPEAVRRIQECQKAFDRIAQQTRDSGIALTNGQQEKFGRKAREMLQQDDIPGRSDSAISQRTTA